uniref:Beta-carotene hydroxylase 2ic-like n=1 Tax=Rhizophora mucronata TaxID=61149 RepID=A0A2P2K3X0_RHIMU
MRYRLTMYLYGIVFKRKREIHEPNYKRNFGIPSNILSVFIEILKSKIFCH